MSHIEYDWHSPIWRHLLLALVSNHRLVRYDQRGNGLSDWEVNDFSFEAIVSDLETVVDAAGLNRFALVGLSQGCAVSAAYAARHPERVSRMILYGGYTRGWKRRGTKDKVEQEEAMLALARHGWGQDNPAFRQVFTSLFAPDATAEQMQWYNELQRISTSGDNVVRIDHAFGDIDVSDLLANVVTPTLVLHCRDDSVTPFSEGRRFAKLLPNSNFVALEGRNHLLLETEPAWRRFLSEIQRFIKDLD
jgi:pimeloyl-ACP methyl ester carboxylesterase